MGSLQLLNVDDHASFLRNHQQDPSQYRPDICHQALLTIIDSPLNKSGKIKRIYVHTKKNLLIELSPLVRLPRTFHRFCGLIVKLLQKFSIRSTSSPSILLRVIKGPVSKHFPPGCKKVGLSYGSSDVVDLNNFVRTLTDDCPVAFVVGAFARGSIDTSYIEQLISISHYPLSAAYSLCRITNALETQWNIR